MMPTEVFFPSRVLKVQKMLLYLTLLLLTGVVCSFSEELDKASKNIEPEYLDSLLKEKKYEEFARLLDIDVEHVKPSKGNQLRPMFKKGLYGGDIMLTKAQAEQARQGLRFDVYPTAKWPGIPAQIPYTISSSNFTSTEMQTIRAAIAEWNRISPCIQWVPRTTEKDYIDIFSGSGCWTFLGNIETGVQAMSLEVPGCVSQPLILHEMDHAAGFTHEHQRPDRDDHIRMLWDNIPDDSKPSYEKANPEHYGIQGDYDYYSIMHYTVAGPIPELDAFEILQDGIDRNRIGNAETLTETDLKKLEVLYC